MPSGLNKDAEAMRKVAIDLLGALQEIKEMPGARHRTMFSQAPTISSVAEIATNTAKMEMEALTQGSTEPVQIVAEEPHLSLAEIIRSLQRAKRAIMDAQNAGDDWPFSHNAQQAFIDLFNAEARLQLAHSESEKFDWQ